MGYGLLYQQLRECEGATATMKTGHKKKTLTGTIRSVNLQDDGLYLMLELQNGECELLTPADKLHSITFTPNPPEKKENKDLESLTGDNGAY